MIVLAPGPFSIVASNRPSVAESIDDLDSDLREQPPVFGRGRIQVGERISKGLCTILRAVF
jgi:hypothetical protein